MLRRAVAASTLCRAVRQPPCRNLNYLPRLGSIRRRATLPSTSSSLLSKDTRSLRSTPINQRWQSTLSPQEERKWRNIGKILRRIFAASVVCAVLYTQLKPKFFVGWDKSVKDNARAALLARRNGDRELSLKYAEQAWKACRSVDISTLGPNPYLTISGIALVYSDFCLEDNRILMGISVLEDAYQFLDERLSQLDQHDKLRMIEMADRIGDLATQCEDDVTAEKWLSLAVECTLKWFRRPTLEEAPSSRNFTIQYPDRYSSSYLFSWLDSSLPKSDPSAPFVNLARFYSNRRVYELALPLFLVALDIVMRPNSAKSPEMMKKDEDTCRGAMLMAEIASAIIMEQMKREPTDPEALLNSESREWAKKAEHTSKLGPACEDCDTALEGAMRVLERFERFDRFLPQAVIRMREANADAGEAR